MEPTMKVITTMEASSGFLVLPILEGADRIDHTFSAMNIHANTFIIIEVSS